MLSNSSIGVLLSLLLVGFSGFFAYLYNVYWLQPERLLKKLRRQANIGGPPPSFFYGNIMDIKKIQERYQKAKPSQQGQEIRVSHDYFSYCFPHFLKWRQEYGPVFMFCLGNKINLYIDDFDLVKTICQCKSTEFGRASYLRNYYGPLFGDSIITAIGTSFVRQRKILSPEFSMSKIKDTMHIMTGSATSMVRKWEHQIVEKGGIATIRVDENLKELAADVISKAMFGSHHAEGDEIYALINPLYEALTRQAPLLGLPGLRYLPIEGNRVVWRIGKKIRKAILKLIADHKKKETKEEDILQVLIENSENADPSIIVDNCKAMFFAGHETTSIAAAFALVLLAHHPDWQTKVRNELEDIGVNQNQNQNLNMDMLNKMKTLTMVIHEILRLYPAVPLLYRETAEEMKFGDLAIPKDVVIIIPVVTLHQNQKIWGQDGDKFNPQRFANGLSGATSKPYLYMPFGMSIRTCLGQNFAILQLKIILSLILSKFTFSLSSDYRHDITPKLTPEPINGVHLVMQRI